MQPNLKQQETNIHTVPSREKAHHQREFTHHIWAFIVSMGLTALAFYAVVAGFFESNLVLGMFLVLLATIQVFFQLFVWMHMNQKGHSSALVAIFSGLFVAIITVAALMLLIWWF